MKKENNMVKKLKYSSLAIASAALSITACKLPAVVEKTENNNLPASYGNSQDTLSAAKIKWKEYFTDPYLNALIDTALVNNQELNITLQEIEMSRNEVRARKGEYLPFVGVRAGVGAEKAAKYTLQGALEEKVPIVDDKENPKPVGDFLLGVYANWEIDIWNKLHNATKASYNHFLASMEGRNFVITNLIAEVANSYYELLALDNQLDIVNKNIEILTSALEIVKMQKEATRVTELAVKKFEAEVLKTKSMQYDIKQQVTETENKINFLLGRYPQPIARNDQSFNSLVPPAIHAGMPAQLLANRPDIRQAELEITAAKLDIKVAKAQFYPSLGISAAFGYQAFNPSYFLHTPESILYSLAGDLMAPLVNRNAIKATYMNASAKQIQAVYNYQKTVINAYVEVANQLSKIGNLEKSYDLKSQQVDALTQSIDISNALFKSARADYMEVLMTQRDALESKFELVETKKQQMNAMVNVYRALGGGW
ncbi:efflux transporter, outer membrane factor (OMF) lipoprotein, NodT family [Filimonas lacunae]|uniref:Efflux transporter, outer membrane factor (OMF) lipoprotein, NodT family n=1 Tax=Filimonas lacunae TaxID=477680 RepID=A0A1N7QMD6_9BACT|nr:TolC family protein [Filimonas lacunae]SIT23993.1 efflux transporter, outer membrane factor (OMF) lipoprotein, NodT family [Filimonas lacunae]